MRQACRTHLEASAGMSPWRVRAPGPVLAFALLVLLGCSWVYGADDGQGGGFSQEVDIANAIGEANAVTAQEERETAFLAAVTLANNRGWSMANNEQGEACFYCLWACRMSVALDSELSETVTDIHTTYTACADREVVTTNTTYGRTISSGGDVGVCKRKCVRAVDADDGSLIWIEGGSSPIEDLGHPVNNCDGTSTDPADPECPDDPSHPCHSTEPTDPNCPDDPNDPCHSDETDPGPGGYGD